jgi:hypothetical protein
MIAHVGANEVARPICDRVESTAMLSSREIEARFDSDEFSLEAIARLLDSTVEVLHVDRHVLEIDENASRSDAIHAAIALAIRWSAERGRLDTRYLVSDPYVIVDDDWLSGGTEATPPHVYICIAQHASVFDPVMHDDAVPSSLGVPELDVYDVYSAEGCWIIRPLRR